MHRQIILPSVTSSSADRPAGEIDSRGAALATFGIFAPSFAMTLIFTEVFGRVRDVRAVRGALAGVLASFVGLLAVVTLQLGPGGADNVGRPRPRRGRVRRGALDARPGTTSESR